MTKRTQKLAQPAPAAEPRRHRRLRQREAMIQRRVILGVSIVVGLIVVLLLGGIINETLLKPRQPIAEVNGNAISTAAFQRRLRFEQDNLVGQINQYIQFGQQFSSDGSNPFQSFINQLFGDLSSPQNFSLQVVDTLIEETLVRQLAAQQEITVSEEEVQRQIEQQFGYDRDAPPPPTPDSTAAITDTLPTTTTLTAETFAQRYQETVDALKDRDSLDETEFRDLARVDLLRERLLAAAPLEFSSTEAQIKARHLLISITPERPTTEQAEADALAQILEVQARLQAGEDFAALATELSEDTGSAAQGGDLGFFGRGMMVPEFEEAAFALEIGAVSEPVRTQFGYHLLRLEERNEETDEVRASHILIRSDTEPSPEAVAAAEAAALATIEALRARILAGEAFADVAKEASADTSSAESGGDLGWFWSGNSRYDDDFTTAALALAVGEVSAPVKSTAGYHLILVEEKDAAREVEAAELESRRSDAFDAWLDAQLAAATVERYWSLDRVPALPADLQAFVRAATTGG
ncbi:MAG: peptidylprolyl isomerase [Caldilineales bacterium]|nr:peptidylprolyl isomerase [Caldilineales bacterium]